ncbi:MAG: Lrp/AsnC family transcriptional regulator [Acidimicrobiia bacterium]
MARPRRPLELQAHAALAVDQTDLEILHLLSQDGRSSYAALGRELGLSDGTVRQRVERLFGAGAAVPVAFLDHGRLPRMAVMWFGLRARPGHLEEVTAALREVEEVTYLVLCTGRFHLLGELRAASMEGTYHVLTERIAALPLEVLESFPALDEFKEEVTWLPPSGTGPVSL